ncbi:MAG: hypothetical protein HN348_13795, partial [Proteobacteria bacterium]|nr:hypothetical protein [Pseudomonadota bacterium]
MLWFLLTLGCVDPVDDSDVDIDLTESCNGMLDIPLPDGVFIAPETSRLPGASHLDGEGVTTDGEHLVFEDEGWALYSLGTEEGRLPTGLQVVASGSYWIGLPDYDLGCWEWRGPFTDSGAVSFWHDGASYSNDNGNLSWIILAEDALTLENAKVHSKDENDEALITTIFSEDLGTEVAIRIIEPTKERYSGEGAPVVVVASGWFAGVTGFNYKFDFSEIGVHVVSYLWPGTADDAGAVSGGSWDYVGPDSLIAMRESIRFSLGEIPNVRGMYIDEITTITPLTDNVGIYASSHPGVGATLVLGHHGDTLGDVKFLIGRENPTRDEMYPLEIGHWNDDDGSAVTHPYYKYPDDYSPTMITVDYSTAGWIQDSEYPQGQPYLVRPDGTKHIFGTKGPKIEGVRYFSRALTEALETNDVFAPDPWPNDLATWAETLDFWPGRVVVDGSVNSYEPYATNLPDLKVMLLFAADDHVQTALDKPHVHHAVDGFKNTASLWVRLNPDAAYMDEINPSSYEEREANSEPDDWSNVRSWGYSN